VDHVGAEADVAHHLDAAADPDVDLAGADERRDEVVGLLAGAALRVDGGAARVPAVPAREPGVAHHVPGLLAGLRDAAADHLLDVGGVDAGALDQRLLRPGQELRGMQAREPPAPELAPRDRGPQGSDDHRFAHRCLLSGAPFRAGRAAAGGRSGFPSQSLPSSMPLVGTPTPAVTSTQSFRAGWLTDVPRTSRTPSFTPLMPWM
jgi:hypothetical protein